MNAKCNICGKDFRLPEINKEMTVCVGDNKGIKNFGLACQGRHEDKGINVVWQVWPDTGSLCASCCHLIIAGFVEGGAKDLEGLLAGRNYGPHHIKGDNDNEND